MPNENSLHPTSGARFLLERTGESADSSTSESANSSSESTNSTGESANSTGESANSTGESANSSADSSANYDAAILTIDARIDYKAVLGDDGSVELTPVDNAGAEALHKKLHNIAVVTARGVNKRRADGLAAWPHRILRWRKT